jgi:formylglycine-generating enzyme required for sulfatase activity
MEAGRKRHMMTHKLRALIPLLAFGCALVAACGAQTGDKTPAPASSPAAASTTQAAAGTGGEALDRSAVSAGSWDAGPNIDDYMMIFADKSGSGFSIVCDNEQSFYLASNFVNSASGAEPLAAEGRLIVGASSFAAHTDGAGGRLLLEIEDARQFLGSLTGAAGIKIDAGQLQIELPSPPPLMLTWFIARCSEYIAPLGADILAGTPAAGSVTESSAAAFAAARAGRPLAERGFRDRLSFGTAGPEMVALPTGSFTMGSPHGEGFDDERPQHLVVLDRNIAVGKFEVTWDEFNLCHWDGPCPRPDDDGFGGGRRPVTNVSWEDAKTYVDWLSRSTGQSYRLLSEAEWEYAARAGSTTTYPWGAVPGVGKANCDGCGSQWDNTSTAPVGSFEANAFGLHDMPGNVWEWVEDCFADSYSAGQPTTGDAFSPPNCDMRVNRGGSWSTTAPRLRSAYRLGAAPSDTVQALGFRIARS